MDGVPGDGGVQPQLVPAPDGGGLPAETEPDQHTVRPLWPAGVPLLSSPAGLVPAGGPILSGATAAAAATTAGPWSIWTRGPRHTQDAAAGGLHAALLP